MREEDFIVSKTDAKGRITYANEIFIEFSEYDEIDLIGKPHNIIRHSDMPRSVFRFMWQTLQKGEEFSGYVKNASKYGGFYWVFANVTPSYGENNEVIGYFSVRRKPSREAVSAYEKIYKEMKEEESKHTGANDAMNASFRILDGYIKQSGVTYNEMVVAHEM
ncbi:MAG: PAS domain-containing protein [Gammaproteobacteria bacterium]|nr:PAS domain-containing protein [Gammaproteobacteria bacterium]